MIKTRIRNKRDTLSNWTNSNPILLNGEIVIVEDGDSILLKRGDGTKRFNQLPFIGSDIDISVFATKTELSDMQGSLNTMLSEHSSATNNPHDVTKAQIGLGNVDNTADANKTVKKAATADTATTANSAATATKATKDASGNVITETYATKTELSTMEGSVKTYIDAHSTDTSNPHGVTKAQLGLDKVDNTADSAKTVKAAGTATKATQDASGNVITTTYATKTELGDASDAANTYTDQKLGSLKYAGSSSVGGAATSANKINTDAGGTTQPVYFSNGIPVKTTYTLGASVPSGAKFTDTTYSAMTAATASAAGKAGLVPAPAAGKQTSFLRGDGTWVIPTNTTYSAATSSAAGLMSAADKSKLDGIASGANNYTYTLPTASSSTLGGVKTTSTVTSTSGLTACPIISGVPYYKDTNNTYSLSSFSITATAAELNVLDGITATTAELNYCDGVTSNIQTQLNSKLSTSGTAAKATADASGNTITSTYETKANAITGLSVSGKTITYTKGNGTTGTITTQDTNTTYSNMTAATSSAAGAAGLVPAPAAGKQASFLRGDGTWVVPTNTTYTAMTATEATNGTATTARSITAKVLHDKISAMVSASSASVPLKKYT